MDANKLIVLRALPYEIKKVCALCKHGNFPKNEWGMCEATTYSHKKHSESLRNMSIHKFGSCPSFESDIQKVSQLGTFMEFAQPITHKLAIYLRLEKSMLDLDASGDEALADRVRDAMDPIWWALSNEERAYLNSRGTQQKAPSMEIDFALYECEDCSTKPGSPALCERCLVARKAAGNKWRGTLPK